MGLSPAVISCLKTCRHLQLNSPEWLWAVSEPNCSLFPRDICVEHRVFPPVIWQIAVKCPVLCHLQVVVICRHHYRLHTLVP
jgi:hypothetical protein